jgi:hypothetical protein
MGAGKLVIGVGLLGLVLTLGCESMGAGGGGTSYHPVEVGPPPPPTQGVVKVSAREDDARTVELQVDHLPPPDATTPGALTYVVWVKPYGTVPPANLGPLQTDGRGRGRFLGTTSLASFELFVTAEPDGQVQRPSGQFVLRARVHGYFRSTLQAGNY